MSAGHTKGPWRPGRIFATVVADHPVTDGVIQGDEVEFYGGYLIAESCAGVNIPLMTAAPDLFEALTMVRDADDNCKSDGLPTIPSTARAKIDAALKKATGEAS